MECVLLVFCNILFNILFNPLHFVGFLCFFSSHPNNEISKRKEFDKRSFLHQQVAFSGVKMFIILCTAALVDPIWALGGTNKQPGVKFSLVCHFSEITRFATHFLSCFGPIFSLVLKGLNRSQSFDQIRTVHLFIKKTAPF